MNPRRGSVFYLHRSHLLSFVDIARSKGLEIGAHDLAMVEPHEGACDIADFRTTDELIELARLQDGHNPNFVIPVRYDLRDGYDKITETYDWIGAAHVIEHVPDVIGWLQTLAEKLKAGGTLFLIVPDKRFMFDRHRRTTTITDLMEWRRLGLKTPSYTQVFDHHYFASDPVDPAVAWSGAALPPARKDYELAAMLAERCLTDYVDAHCSVFTPESFASLLTELSDFDLIPFVIQEIRSTQFNQLDFSVVLQKK